MHLVVLAHRAKNTVLVLTCRAHLNPAIESLLPVRRALCCGGALLVCESPSPEKALAGAANFALFEPASGSDPRRRAEAGSMNREQRMEVRRQLQAGGSWREHAGAGGRDAALALVTDIMNGAGGFATDGWRIASSEWRNDHIVWSTRRRVMMGVALLAYVIGLDSPVEHGSSGKEVSSSATPMEAEPPIKQLSDGEGGGSGEHDAAPSNVPVRPSAATSCSNARRVAIGLWRGCALATVAACVAEICTSIPQAALSPAVDVDALSFDYADVATDEAMVGTDGALTVAVTQLPPGFSRSKRIRSSSPSCDGDDQ